MKKINQLKEAVVKATMVLSQNHQAGWTLSQLMKASGTNLLVSYTILKHMMKVGYIAQLRSGKYIYQKKFNSDQLNQITKMIVSRWDSCVYSTYAANRAIPRPISSFTAEELEQELCKRYSK